MNLRRRPCQEQTLLGMSEHQASWGEGSCFLGRLLPKVPPLAPRSRLDDADTCGKTSLDGPLGNQSETDSREHWEKKACDADPRDLDSNSALGPWTSHFSLDMGFFLCKPLKDISTASLKSPEYWWLFHASPPDLFNFFFLINCQHFKIWRALENLEILL